MLRLPIVRLLAAGAAVAAACVVVAPSIAGTTRRAAVATVAVTVSDRALRVTPSVLHAGTTVFVVRNTGKKKHAFAVSGPGVKSSHTATLQTGTSTKLTVTLRSGTYMLADPVGLGAYSVQYVNVVPATSLTGTGGSNVVSSAGDSTSGAMCGGSFSP